MVNNADFVPSREMTLLLSLGLVRGGRQGRWSPRWEDSLSYLAGDFFSIFAGKVGVDWALSSTRVFSALLRPTLLSFLVFF